MSMRGFFTKAEVQSSVMAQGKKLSCFSCGLYKDAQSPKMEPYGNFKKKVMIIGEAPGRVEDRNGKPWQGKTGKLLERTLAGIGINLFEDCVSLNAVNCKPLNNRTPSPHEIACCRDVKVLKALSEFKPEVILLLGSVSLTSFLSHRLKTPKTGGITKWRGWAIPDQDYQAWIYATFHPSYVERMNSKEVYTIWERDLRRAFELKLFFKIKEPEIEYIDLVNLPKIDSDMAALDYETPGIKPQAKGHKIVCGSIADTPDHVYAFMMPNRKRDWEPLLDFLRDRRIKKIAANFKFEDNWSSVRLKTRVRGWYWDTMLNAHILDNRRYVTGLKFQAYTQLGVIDYNSRMSNDYNIDYYLKNKKGSQFNRLDELLEKPGGKEQLLEYCALDSIYEYRIALIQMDEISDRILPF